MKKLLRKKVVFMILLAIVIFVAGSYLFFEYSKPPKETLSKEFKQEAVTKLLGRKAQLDVENVPTGNVAYKGKHLSFFYPAKALIYEYKDSSFASNSAILDSFSFDIKQPRIVFNMKVQDNKSSLSSIEEYPAAKLRQQRSYEYTQRDVSVDGQQGKVYEKKSNGAESSAFFLVSNKVYTFAVTGNDFEQVQSVAGEVLRSVKFAR